MKFRRTDVTHVTHVVPTTTSMLQLKVYKCLMSMVASNLDLISHISLSKVCKCTHEICMLPSSVPLHSFGRIEHDQKIPSIISKLNSESLHLEIMISKEVLHGVAFRIEELSSKICTLPSSITSFRVSGFTNFIIKRKIHSNNIVLKGSPCLTRLTMKQMKTILQTLGFKSNVIDLLRRWTRVALIRCIVSFTRNEDALNI